MLNDFLPLFPKPRTKEEINRLNPDVLSFVGDSVQTLFVRSKLSLECNQNVGSLHKITASYVKAVSQAKAVKRILDILSEDEVDIYKRCRNHKTNSTAKNASVIEYKVASGFEGLIGYLYLSGDNDRLSHLLTLAYIKED